MLLWIMNLGMAGSEGGGGAIITGKISQNFSLALAMRM